MLMDFLPVRTSRRRRQTGWVLHELAVVLGTLATCTFFTVGLGAGSGRTDRTFACADHLRRRGPWTSESWTTQPRFTAGRQTFRLLTATSSFGIGSCGPWCGAQFNQ